MSKRPNFVVFALDRAATTRLGAAVLGFGWLIFATTCVWALRLVEKVVRRYERWRGIETWNRYPNGG